MSVNLCNLPKVNHLVLGGICHVCDTSMVARDKARDAWCLGKAVRVFTSILLVLVVPGRWSVELELALEEGRGLM